MDSKILACALDNMNEAVILDVKQHYAKPDEKPYPDEQVSAVHSAICEWLAFQIHIFRNLAFIFLFLDGEF